MFYFSTAVAKMQLKTGAGSSPLREPDVFEALPQDN